MDTRHLAKNEIVALNNGYGLEELIQFKYRVGRFWARGVSLTWPGVWQHFNLQHCRIPDSRMWNGNNG